MTLKKPLTEKQRKKALALKKKGWAYSKIAKHMNLSKSRIRWQIFPEVQARYRERAKQRSREWYHKNKEYAKQQSLEWARNNPEKIREIQARHRKTELNRISQRKYNRKPEVKRRKNEWSRTTEKGRMIKERYGKSAKGIALRKFFSAKRRAMIVNAPVCKGQEITKPKLVKLLGKDKSKNCAYCNVKLSQKGLTRPSIDHRTSLNREGHHCMNNLSVSCITCNARKRDLSVREYKAMLRKESKDKKK